MPRRPLPPNVTRLPRPGRKLMAVIGVRKIEREGGSECAAARDEVPAEETAEVEPFRKPGPNEDD